ncbi:aldo/keto reductase [Actinoplanes derwentensis]|uniref:2,5-diketo-D-gluconate reductase A n=1 Tax=Actinoplanes derwentensis TaxID=113562 RepID=A0A1H1VKW6_9ACTN|nr:aldo/keto reductase [Actinoplanes derwentensis]GID83663.1 oxidoreductase [Actinoplanes derwentensis]SDS85547.1 2,5-diketo-D-gluconate reductase A [Actinoplanes derwentensis]
MAETITLLHGAEIPRIGAGTWPLNDADAERVVADALAAGYRLIDTAQAYGNELGVGRGLKAAGVERGDVFVTSKFNKQWHGREKVAEAVRRSLDTLGLDYLDLFLIHWPNPAHDKYVEAWEGLVALLEAGTVRAIGTSNFKPAHLERIIAATGVAPDVNQIQLSPASTRAAARAFHAEHGIVTESWSPIGGQGVRVLDLPVVGEIARQTGRTGAQVVLRWHLQTGLLPIPKSADPQRLRENLDVFGFELTEEQMTALSALDQGESAVVDSDVFGH